MTRIGMDVARLSLLAACMMVTPSAPRAEPPPGATSCWGCHPPAGADGPIATLSGRKADEIVMAMQAFRTGMRPATVMDRIARGFSDEETRAIADWLASGRK